MKRRSVQSLTLLLVFMAGCFLSVLAVVPWAHAALPFHFSTGTPDGQVALASRPDNTGEGKIEIEAGDDFVVTSAVTIKNATFTGLLVPGVSSISEVLVEIYRVFPLDSANPPSGNVPTRTNSPSDSSYDSENSISGGLSYTATVLNPSYTASNSVINGINKIPNQLTGGEGAITGEEDLFNVTFAVPLMLPSGHYFFVPQVDVTGGEFLWLSAPKPITSGTPFTGDLQTWIRNANLKPDWLRVGTDIIGSGAYNGAFSLDGTYSAAAPVFQVPAILVFILAVATALCVRESRSKP